MEKTNSDKMRDFLQSMPEKNILSYTKGSPVMIQGEETTEMAYILSGKVRAVLLNQNGDEVNISIHGAGEYICEASYAENNCGIVSIYAEEDTEIFPIDNSMYFEIISKYPEISIQIIRSIASKVGVVLNNFDRYMSTNIEQRAAHALLMLAKECGEETEGGTKITIRLTDEEFGKFTGSRREVINRLFRALRKEEIIAKKDGYIYILNMEKIKNLTKAEEK